jgi:exosome complex component RRP4
MEKQLVLPGALAASSPRRMDGCYVDGGKTYVAVVSLKAGDKIIPLKGHYLPRIGDYIIGIVSEERFSGYEVDINSPFPSSISARDIRETFEVGDVVSAKVRMVDEVHTAQLVEPRKLHAGRLIEIESVKVPRVIGRNGSMLALIKEYTGSDIFVGKNGRIYVRNGDIALSVMALLKISSEAHTSGLTDRIKELLETESRKSPQSGTAQKASPQQGPPLQERPPEAY